jgi:HSP20 family protein
MTLVKFQPAAFRSFFPEYQPANWSAQPAVNILETKEGFRLELATPGLAKEDLSIQVKNNTLTIAANQTAEKTTDDTNWHRREFSHTAFERAFRLPNTIDSDNISATLTNGILKVELHKKPEHQPVVKTVAIA